VYVTVSAFMVAPHCPTTVKVYAICVTSYTHLCLRSFLVLGRSTGIGKSSRSVQFQPSQPAARNKGPALSQRYWLSNAPRWRPRQVMGLWDWYFCVCVSCTYVRLCASIILMDLIIMIVYYVYLTTTLVLYCFLSSFDIIHDDRWAGQSVNVDFLIEIHVASIKGTGMRKWPRQFVQWS